MRFVSLAGSLAIACKLIFAIFSLHAHHFSLQDAAEADEAARWDEVDDHHDDHDDDDDAGMCSISQILGPTNVLGLCCDMILLGATLQRQTQRMKKRKLSRRQFESLADLHLQSQNGSCQRRWMSFLCLIPLMDSIVQSN